MVKFLTRILTYNWRHYVAAVLVFIVAAVLVFIAFWQGYSAFSAVRVADGQAVDGHAPERRLFRESLS